MDPLRPPGWRSVPAPVTSTVRRARPIAALLLVVGMVGLSPALGVRTASATTVGDRIAAYAAAQAGTAYCDGGGGIHGPTNGGVVENGCGAGAMGFDCLSLVQYAVYEGTGIILPGDGTQLPGVGTYIPPRATPAASAADLEPGDAVYWGGTIGAFSHSGIYAGNGGVWDAIGVNQPVQVHSMAYLGAIYHYDGAIRYGGAVSTVPSGTGGTGGTVPTTTSGGLVTPVVGIASTPDGHGYWLTDAAGGVSAHGSAVNYGSLAGHPLNAPIAHIVPTADGHGYWLVAADGGIFAFGDASFLGSMGGSPLNAPVVDMAPAPDGHGYWLVAADGGIFAFGSAGFHGSMGGQPLNQPIVGMSADGATGGYWLVASDGGIFSFDAPFLGSTGSIHLDQPVNGMAAQANGTGYWFVASDGGVFSAGTARFLGSMGGSSLVAPVVGLAADPATGGYWLVGNDGGVFSFGAPYLGAG